MAAGRDLTMAAIADVVERGDIAAWRGLVAALSRHLGLRKSAAALERMNGLYAEFAGEGGDMLGSVIVELAKPYPYDLTEIDLSEYKGIVAPWNDWRSVERQCRSLAAALLDAPDPKLKDLSG